MRKRLTTLLVSGAAVALTAGLGMSAAAANTINATWTIHPGGNITGTAGTTTLKDTKTGTTLTCTSSKATGTAKNGTGLPGAGIASIKTLSFSNCSGPAGLTFTVTVNSLPYPLNAVSYASGVTSGTITHIDAKLSGPGCSMVVDGPSGPGTHSGMVNGKYSNTSGVLSTSGGNLHIWSVSGCFGLVGNGDGSTFSGKYTITPKQTITSP